MTDGLLTPGAALIDAGSGELIDTATLRRRVEAVAEPVARLPEGVVLARTPIDVASIVRYLGALQAERAVAVIDPGLDAVQLTGLIERFRPAAVLGADPATEEPGGYRSVDLAGPAWRRMAGEGIAPHPELAVLLPTSGSTGNPKLVRLSRAAILANARSITQALSIGAAEIAPTSLPLHYVYGLSVVNSHLLAGATLLVEPSAIVARTFWEAVAAHGATSLAGVPYHYELLGRLRFDPARYPRLRTLTQSGGRLRPDLITEMATRMDEVGGRMYLMYGATEAAPRMATLPPGRVLDKLGSVGLPVPGGAFEIRPLTEGQSAGPGVPGEIVYRGPNVMMGYAQSAEELALPDQMGGVWATGDLGYLDDEGFLFITGRLKRMGKVFGHRVNLDDIEQMVLGHGPAAAVPGDDTVVVWLEGADPESCRIVAKELAEHLRQHPSGFDVRGIAAMPLLPNGKIDHHALSAL